MAVEPALQVVTENGRKNEYWYQDLSDNLVISQNRFFLGSLKLDLDISYQNNNRQLKGDEPDEHFTLVDMTLQTFSFTAKASHSINEKARYIIGFQGMIMDNKNGEAPDHVLPDASMNDISFYGLFQYSLNSVKLEAGLRYSYRSIFVPFQEAGGGHSHDEEEEEEEETEYVQYDGQFDNISASIGTTWNMNEDNLIRLNIASAFRSPNLAELTQRGRHGVRYEEGNHDLNMQQNIEFDLGYHLHTRHTTLDLSIFYNYIYNYIHLAPTSDTTDDGDKIYRYMQANAVLFGGEASLHIHPHPIHWLHLIATFSQVYGEYVGGGYLPRIPANDLYLEVRLEKQKWKGLRDIYLEGGVDIVFAQNNPSMFESTTSGYNLVNLGFGFDVQLKRNRLSFNLKVSNLLNIQYYDHLSTLQDIEIYNMGRNIMVGMRLPFNIKN
jgi:iron complex outermembrane receptor protein